MRRVRRIAALAALVGPWLTAVARGDEHRADVSLAWTAPSDCPTRDDVLAEIDAILRGSSTTGRPVDARAQVVAAGMHWHVDLAIRSAEGDGERSFDAGSCKELGSAVALIVALAVDPSSKPLAAPEAGAPVASPSAEAGPPEPSASPSARGEGFRLAAGVAAAVDLGALPAAAPGGAVMLAGLLGRARIEARGALLASQRTTDPTKTQGVDIGLLLLGGRGCFAVIASGRDGPSVSPCVGVAWNRASATGFGVGTASSTTATALSNDATWLSLDTGLLGALPLTSWIALRLDADLVVPTERPRFVVLAPDRTVSGVLHRPASLGARGAAGAEIRFW